MKDKPQAPASKLPALCTQLSRQNLDFFCFCFWSTISRTKTGCLSSFASFMHCHHISKVQNFGSQTNYFGCNWCKRTALQKIKKLSLWTAKHIWWPAAKPVLQDFIAWKQNFILRKWSCGLPLLLSLLFTLVLHHTVQCMVIKDLVKVYLLITPLKSSGISL